ncbi:DNA-methyltransferase [Streptomyces sp. NBC_01508]|uniref:DNA-methyltransferase n=1 Tax=Streptomyces sp. NBC_01508 TaxID=2903888 RepID=UPI00386CCCE7
MTAAPYYADEQVTLLLGDALEQLTTLPDGSADCIVTSPPYFGLRDYGTPGQYGLEATPAEYVETMRGLFAEARRVLADDGTLWLNLGDSYYSGKGEPTQPDEKNAARRMGKRTLDGPSWGLPRKNLLGIPWRVAFALQDDGWLLRNEIIWHKPNAMPESVRDRLSSRHEHLFLFTKSARYAFDLDPIREPHAPSTLRPTTARVGYAVPGQTLNVKSRPVGDVGRNPGDVWSINTRPFPAAHFATFPIDLPLRCIKAGCRPGGTVLDPFSGSGTTGAAARQLGRKYIGIDLNPAYHDLAVPRFAQGVLDFGETA